MSELRCECGRLLATEEPVRGSTDEIVGRRLRLADGFVNGRTADRFVRSRRRPTAPGPVLHGGRFVTIECGCGRERVAMVGPLGWERSFATAPHREHPDLHHERDLDHAFDDPLEDAASDVLD